MNQVPLSPLSGAAATECRARIKIILFDSSFSSAVDKRTRNNLNDAKPWVHIFSDSFGSVVDKRTRNDLYAREVLYLAETRAQILNILL